MEQCCSEQWQEIIPLEEKSPRTMAEEEKLQELKHCFTLVIGTDYQMQKLVPHWGRSVVPRTVFAAGPLRGLE